MPRCKASEILKNEAYIEVRAVTRDEGNAADGHFPTASSVDLSQCTLTAETLT